MAGPEGFEPPACRLGGGRSIQLSYGPSPVLIVARCRLAVDLTSLIVARLRQLQVGRLRPSPAEESVRYPRQAGCTGISASGGGLSFKGRSQIVDQAPCDCRHHSSRSGFHVLPCHFWPLRALSTRRCYSAKYGRAACELLRNVRSPRPANRSTRMRFCYARTSFTTRP